MEDANDLTSKVCGEFAGSCINLALPQPDDCKSLKSGEKCPVSKGSSYEVTISVPIEKLFPKVCTNVGTILLTVNTF